MMDADDSEDLSTMCQRVFRHASKIGRVDVRGAQNPSKD